MRKAGKGAAAALFLAAVAAGFGCESNDAPPALFALDGDLYNKKFSCNQTFTGQPTTCPDLNKTGTIQFQLVASNSYEAREVPDTGYLLTGSFSGLDFHWTATSPNGYFESGTWTFTLNGNSFLGQSQYFANDGTYSGDCNTNANIGLGPVPDPPAPIGCP